jgi:hypothetical protein
VREGRGNFCNSSNNNGIVTAKETEIEKGTAQEKCSEINPAPGNEKGWGLTLIPDQDPAAIVHLHSPDPPTYRQALTATHRLTHIILTHTHRTMGMYTSHHIHLIAIPRRRRVVDGCCLVKDSSRHCLLHILIQSGIGSTRKVSEWRGSASILGFLVLREIGIGTEIGRGKESKENACLLING